MSVGKSAMKAVKVPDPVPIPIEVDLRQREEDIRKSLSKTRSRTASQAAGFLTTPPIVSDLALFDKLG